MESHYLAVQYLSLITRCFLILDMTMAGPDGQYYVVLDVSQLEVSLMQHVQEGLLNFQSIRVV